MSSPYQTSVDYHRSRDAADRAEREELRSKVLAAVRLAIREVAPDFEAIHAVYLFGSILRPGHFNEHSDVDVAIDSTDVFIETRFRRELEDRCQRSIDLRPRVDRVAEAVELSGEKVYERKIPAT